MPRDLLILLQIETEIIGIDKHRFSPTMRLQFHLLPQVSLVGAYTFQSPLFPLNS